MLPMPNACLWCNKDCSFLAFCEGLCIDCADRMQAIPTTDLIKSLAKAVGEVKRLEDYGHKKDGSLHLSPEAAKALQHALDWIGWAENPHAQDLQSEARIKVVNRLREFMNIAINTSNASFSVYT